MKKIVLMTVITITLILTSCANSAGESVECPTCDNIKEVLVGTKCVPIEEISECGPDGHSHGENEPCHCFSDQEETDINGKKYCLQLSCETKECNNHGKLENNECICDNGFIQDKNDKTLCVKEIEDLDKYACNKFLEEVTKKELAKDDFNGQHIKLDTKNVITLLKDKESYIHFAVEKDAKFIIYIDKVDILDSIYSKDGTMEHTITSLGENSDCKDDIKAVYEVDIKRTISDIAKEPAVLKFKPFDGDITIFVHEKI